MTPFIPPKLVHHSTKVTAALIPLFTLANSLRSHGWPYAVAMWIIGALLFASAISTNMHRPYCAACPTRSQGELRRFRFRVARGFARTLWPQIALGLVITVIMPPLRPDHAKNLHDMSGPIPLAEAIVWAALLLDALALRSAIRFTRRYHPRRPLADLGQAVKKVTHKSHWLLVGALLPYTALAIFAPDEGVWSSLQSLAIFLMVLGFMAAEKHDDSLCEECHTRFPVNAPAYAASKRWAFTVQHRVMDPLILPAIIAMAAGPYIGNAWQVLLVAFGNLTVMMFALFIRFHHTYELWCPFCRRNGGRGDGDDPVEAPDPVGGNSRPVPA